MGHSSHIIPAEIGQEFNRALHEDHHAIPDLDVPDGWFENDPVCHPDGGEWGIRSACWRYHVEVQEAAVDARIEGPYWAELRVQVDPDDSFVTEPVARLTDLEPGAIQDAVYYLVGRAIAHEQGWSE